MGLPQYVAIDKKPENGCEIQNSACSRSGVMLRLKLVKGVDLVGEDDNGVPHENDLLHGTKSCNKCIAMVWDRHNCVC